MKLADIVNIRQHENKGTGGTEGVFLKSAKRMLKRMAQIKREKPIRPSDNPVGWRASPYNNTHNGINWR